MYTGSVLLYYRIQALLHLYISGHPSAPRCRSAHILSHFQTCPRACFPPEERHLCPGDPGEVLTFVLLERTFLLSHQPACLVISTDSTALAWPETRPAKASKRVHLHFAHPSPPLQPPATQASRHVAPPNDSPPPLRAPRLRAALPIEGWRGRAARASSPAEAAARARLRSGRGRYQRGRRSPRRYSCAPGSKDGSRGSQGPRRPSGRDLRLAGHGPKSALWEKRNTCLSLWQRRIAWIHLLCTRRAFWRKVGPASAPASPDRAKLGRASAPLGRNCP